jgi:hypothetical protein
MEGEGQEMEGKEGKGRENDGRSAPLSQILDTPLISFILFSVFFIRLI